MQKNTSNLTHTSKYRPESFAYSDRALAVPLFTISPILAGISLSKIAKRAIDILGATIGMIILLPVLLAVAIAIRFDSSGPVIYPSRRVGLQGKSFSCLKFRTMVQNAHRLRNELSHLNERNGVLFKIAKDPRITRVGAFLRRYSIDELPQLWNVLIGNMSLVGPRPSLRNEVAQYTKAQRRRLDALPGITGLWQVKARHDPSFESYIRLDHEYVDQWSIWLDLKILLSTIGVVLRGTGT